MFHNNAIGWLRIEKERGYYFKGIRKGCEGDAKGDSKENAKGDVERV